MEMKFRNAYEENEEFLDKIFNEYFINQKDLAENLSNELFKYEYLLKFREDINNGNIDGEIETYILRDYFKIFLIKTYNQDLSQNVLLIEIGGIENNREEINNSTEILSLMIYHILGD